jgi:hypothetical protein
MGGGEEGAGAGAMPKDWRIAAGTVSDDNRRNNVAYQGIGT